MCLLIGGGVLRRSLLKWAERFIHMSENGDKGYKVEFAPGCFDGFEGTQEELDELIKAIQDTFANATAEDLEECSQPIEEVWDELSEDEQKSIVKNFDNALEAREGKKRTLN